MPDKTTYETEMSQPVHKPGMEKIVNRAADDPKDASGNRVGARRTTAPPTRSAFGPDSASDPAPKGAPPPAAPDVQPLSIVGATRTAQNMQTADDASK
jgi:hypothetical protein